MNKTIIGIDISNIIPPVAGGSFSYTNQLIKLIDDYDFDTQFDFLFYSTTQKSQNLKNKKFLLLEVQIELGLKDWLKKITIKVCSLFSPKLSKHLTSKFINDIASRKNKLLDKLLLDHQVKICYHIVPRNVVSTIPFVTTHWDIGHRSTYSFPELISDDQYATREHYYNHILPKALGVIVESETGKQELINYANLFEKKIFTVPIFPGDIVNLRVSKEQQDLHLKKLNLEKGSFFIYPAQFWAHKNHVLIADAIEILKSQFPTLKVAFCGADHGNLKFIENYLSEKNLANNILILGFVTQEQLYTLYKNSLGLIMSTFLGPTNLPPLEALKLGCIPIVSDLAGHKEMLGDNAFYFDPLNASDLSQQLIKVINGISPKGTFSTPHNSDFAIKALERAFLEILKVRNTWN